MTDDAMAYLEEVKARAKELYALSDQGEWEELHPSLQAFWISYAGRELKGEA